MTPLELLGDDTHHSEHFIFYGGLRTVPVKYQVIEDYQRDMATNIPWLKEQLALCFQQNHWILLNRYYGQFEVTPSAIGLSAGEYRSVQHYFHLAVEDINENLLSSLTRDFLGLIKANRVCI